MPTQLLTKAGRDPSFPELERWRGRIGAWYVDALQTTNDSQAGCVPWGTISVVAFSATRANVEQSYAEWRRRLSAMLNVTPEESGSGNTVWPENRQAPWYARWRASVAVTGPGELTIEMSCGDAWTGLRGRRTRG